MTCLCWRNTAVFKDAPAKCWVVAGTRHSDFYCFVPIELCRDTVPIDLCRVTAAIDLCRAMTPIELCRVTAPIDLCRAMAPIDLCRVTTPVVWCRAMAPIDLCGDAAPINGVRLIMQGQSPLRERQGRKLLLALLSRAMKLSPKCVCNSTGFPGAVLGSSTFSVQGCAYLGLAVFSALPWWRLKASVLISGWINLWHVSVMKVVEHGFIRTRPA